MPRYIDAEKIHYRTDYNSPIYENCGGHCCQVGYDQVASYSEISEIPTADVAPVVHGRWRYYSSVCTGEGIKGCFECSACKAAIDEEVFDLMYECGQTRRCGACGAQMDEEMEEDNYED